LSDVLAQLRREYEDSGRGATFDVLRVVLTDDPRAVPQAELAQQLEISTGAVQVAIHRLRRRYRDLLRATIAETVADEAEIEDEIRDLFAALGS
jgi:RNA polymerase sigma-70 factor (ECF subfamily)